MISGIVHLTSKTIYGFSSRKIPIYAFQPFDTSIKPFMVGCSSTDKTSNLLAIAKITDSSVKNPRGFIEKIIGKCGERAAEEEALLWRYAPFRWRKQKTAIIHPKDIDRMFLDVPTINIDPAGCKDIDDCISIWKTAEGQCVVAITIADVHEWLKCNPQILEKAPSFGQTFYNNGAVAAPMLPSELSEDLCSLIPGVPRLGRALIFLWNDETRTISEYRFESVIINNKKSYTYDNIKSATDFPIDILKNVASKLASCEVDDPHEWVEHLMMFYNFVAAKELQKIGYGIWRSHDAPNTERLEKYKHLGDDLERFAFSSAVYSKTPELHWGCKNALYCHATSPIRRWSDVVNQAILKGEPMTFNIDQLNLISKNAKKYERDSVFLNALYTAKSANLGACTILDESRIWIPLWNRIVNIGKTEYPEGTVLNLSYFMNLNGQTWKKRIVFKFEDTNYLELQRREPTVYESLAEAPIVPDPLKS
jgi:exoribonuclease R